MPEVGFEPTITESERANSVHALDRSATVTGPAAILPKIIYHEGNFFIYHFYTIERLE
jgi:hypothetical protein